MIRALALLAALAAFPAQAAELYFCWRGNAGYSMTGMMQFDDALLEAPLITEADVTDFKITGWHGRDLLGSWSLSELTPTTSWLLNFDPGKMRFLMTGYGVFQAWNAHGAVNDCGEKGFGFNAGNGGQDICVNGRFVAESTIPWPTPLLASPTPVQPGCSGPPMVSKRQK